MTTQIIVIQPEQGHTQDTDDYLDYGGAGQVSATSLKALVDGLDATASLGTSDAKFPTQKAVKTYVDAAVALRIALTYLDTDGTLSANSDVKIATQKAVKTYADALAALKIPLTYIDTDGTLAANSDTKLPSQKAVKTYVDLRILLSYLDTDGTLAANSDTKIATQKAVKTYTMPLTYLDTTATLGTSDIKVPSQKAVKTYADTIAKRSVIMIVIDYTTDCSVGNGKGYFLVPDILNGFSLSAVMARTMTPGITGTMDIQIRNETKLVDMLTTKMTIDSTEYDTSTAATPAVIDTSNDEVAVYDLIAVDIDAIHTTASKGLMVGLTFTKA